MSYLLRATLIYLFSKLPLNSKIPQLFYSLNFINNLKKIARGTYASDNDDPVKIKNTYKKGLHNNVSFLALGLHDLIYRENGVFKFNIVFKIT